MPVGVIPTDRVKALRNDVRISFNELISLGMSRKIAYKRVSGVMQSLLGLNKIFGINQVNSIKDAEDAITAITQAKTDYRESLDAWSNRHTTCDLKNKANNK